MNSQEAFSGETMNAVARALRAGGAAKVTGVVLARQTWDPDIPTP